MPRKQPNPGPPIGNLAQKHLDLLGLTAIDKVTGFKGIVDSISFDLYGCIQATVIPFATKNKDKVENSRWFDISRLKITGKKPVMKRPNFCSGPIAEGDHGPAEKPSR